MKYYVPIAVKFGDKCEFYVIIMPAAQFKVISTFLPGLFESKALTSLCSSFFAGMKGVEMHIAHDITPEQSQLLERLVTSFPPEVIRRYTLQM